MNRFFTKLEKAMRCPLRTFRSGNERQRSFLEVRAMNRFFTRVFLGVVLVASLTTFANATAISVNLFSNGTSFGGSTTDTAVGANTAGVVPVGNWNDVPGLASAGSPSPQALMDSSGAATGMTFIRSQLPGGGYYPGSVYSPAGNTAFAGAGDNAMMSGYAYNQNPDGGSTALWVVTSGAVPYPTFDLYVYYNGNLANTQMFQLYNGSTPVGSPQTAVEAASTETSYVQSIGGSAGNYVKFAGLNAADFGTGLVIEALGYNGTGEPVRGRVRVVNGFQIVNVPEPGTMVRLGKRTGRPALPTRGGSGSRIWPVGATVGLLPQW